jgi:hypothetical protein
MKHPIVLLAFAALAATSCSLQLDSQYGLRWDRRVTVPQRAESDFTEAQPEVEPEVALEWHAAESEPQTEAAQPIAIPEAADFEVSLPFGIQMDDPPEAAQPHVERRFEKLHADQTTHQQVNKSLADSAGSVALKVAGVILGICLTLLGALALFVGYFVSIFDSDEAQQFFRLSAVFLVLGALFIIVPQFF